MEDISINYTAVLVAVIANFIFGFIWYTPLFGKAWATEMGMDPDAKPSGGEMAKGMIIMVIGNFFLAYVLAHNLAVWDYAMGDGSEQMMLAISSAFFTWLGFFLPVDLGTITWERKSFKLFAINTSYHLLTLVIVALILVYM